MINDFIEVVRVKSEVINTLNAILEKEAKMYEAEWDDMDMDEAMKRAEAIMKFSNFTHNFNNVDF